MTDAVKLLISGVISIGIATALFYPGRTTAATLKAGGSALQGVLRTAESGR